MLQDHHIPRGTYYILFTLLAVVYILAMLVPVMEVDAAQYASISEQMLRQDSFLVIKHHESDYLDKPPLLFWLSALSMKLFGINSFAYKLPSVLGIVLAIFSTYRFAKLHYNEHTARNASLILASCLCFFLIANDVRTDNLLIGFSMLAIWKIGSWLKHGSGTDLYVGFTAIGLAMLAKGPLGLIFTMFTIGSMLVFRNQFQKLSWKWLWGMPIIGLILTPMCIGLYQQHGIEGLEFFFWKQSFGRITGESEWSNDTDPFFLFHSFLWAFLPWCFLFLPVIFLGIKSLFRKGSPFPFDVGSFGGLFLTMIALSFSRYKLPHYIYIVAPLAAVLTAQYIASIQSSRTLRVVTAIQFITSILFLLAILILITLLHDWDIHWSWILLPLGLIGFWYLSKASKGKNRLVLVATLLMACTGLGLFGALYPQLLTYQSTSQAAFYINEERKEGEQVLAFHTYGHAFSFYQGMSTLVYYDVKKISRSGSGTWVYTNADGLQQLKESGQAFEIKRELPSYPVQFLKLDFILPTTRSKSLDMRYIVYLE